MPVFYVPKFFALTLVVALVAGCSGGGSSLQSLPGPAGRGGSTPSSVNVHLNVPLSKTASASARRPAYVSPSTQSATVTINGGSPVTFNVTPTSPNCAIAAQMTEFASSTFDLHQLAEASDGTMWAVGDSGTHTQQILPGGVAGPSVYNNGDLTVSLGADSDGSMWVGHVYGDPTYDVGHIVGNYYNSVTIGSSNYVTSIARGADGAMYLGYQDSSFAGQTFIGRIAGGVYDADYPAATTSGIARMKAGTDGRLWFIELNGYVGWMQGSTPFTAHEYNDTAAPHANFGYAPYGLAVGPDNSVYFPQLDASNHVAIGHLSAAGATLPSIALPATISPQITGLTYGPDGAIWIANYGDSKVERVTPAGAYTEYPTPLGGASSNVFDVAVGSDREVYFTELSAPKYGTMALSYACSASAPAPLGVSPITIETFDGINGTGNVLGALSTTINVLNDTANNLNLTLNGVVDHVNLIATPSNPHLGCGAPYGGSTVLSAQAVDAGGNIIVNSGGVTDAAGNPLQLTLSTTDTGTDSFSPTVLSWPAALSSTATISNAPNGTITFNAASTGSPAAAVPNGIFPVTVVNGTPC